MKLNLKVFEERGTKYFDHLQEECGVTEVSLENAYYLFKKYGQPLSIDLIQLPNEWYVLIKWSGITSHKFNGFSWGYNGSGPTGLKVLMEILDIKGPSGWTPYQDLGNNRDSVRLYP